MRLWPEARRLEKRKTEVSPVLRALSADLTTTGELPGRFSCWFDYEYVNYQLTVKFPCCSTVWFRFLSVAFTLSV